MSAGNIRRRTQVTGVACVRSFDTVKLRRSVHDARVTCTRNFVGCSHAYLVVWIVMHTLLGTYTFCCAGYRCTSGLHDVPSYPAKLSRPVNLAG